MIRNDLAPKSLFLRLAKASMLSVLALGAAAGLVTTSEAVSASKGIGGPGKLVLRVDDPKDAAEIVAQGGRLVEDYQGFKLVEISEVLAVTPGKSAQVLADNNVIRLNALSIDTASFKAQESRSQLAPFEGKQLRIVSFVGPVKAEWASQIEAAGAKIVSYIPNNAYLVYGDYNSLGGYQLFSQSAPYVQWDGEYLADYKIQSLGNGAEKAGTPKSDLYMVQMVDDASANVGTRAFIESNKLEPIFKERVVRGLRNILVRLPETSLLSLARRPEVLSIQPYVKPVQNDERQALIVSGNTTTIGNRLVPRATANYLSWLDLQNFNQTNYNQGDLAGDVFVVDVTDSGIDNGTRRPGHPGLYELGDTNLPSRVSYIHTFGPTNDAPGCDGHGTVNAHIIAGYAGQTNGVFVDAQGYRYGLGVMPFVKVGSSVIFNTNGFIPQVDFTTLQDRAYTAGARISANSWGAAVFGRYTADSQEYDALVRDAQIDEPANQEMVIVFSAGNSGPFSGSVGSPGTAKNVITVGASENVHPFGGADGSGVTDQGANNAHDIASFSSRGPTSDGRRKPDIMAPGTHVTGGAPQKSGAETNGTVLECFDGSGVSGGVGGLFFPEGQELYTASSGTSQAAPAVAGGAALIRQDFINRGFAPPSPALTKAMLLNSTRYMTGASAGDDLWSNNQGMGLMDIGNHLRATASLTFKDQVAAEKFTATGQKRVYTGRVADPADPIRITVSWTDAPGSTFGASYNNDIDLIVYINGQVYRGNNFSGSFSQAGGSLDRRNNSESVFLPAGTTGEIAIELVAANINSDGVPGNVDPRDQDFAFVASNFVEEAIPVFTADSSRFVAEAFATTNGYVDPGETVTFDFALRNVGLVSTPTLTAQMVANADVTPVTGPLDYLNVASQGSPVTNRFVFTVSSSVPCGTNLPVTLTLDEAGTPRGTVTFLVKVGFRAIAATTASNPQTIVIPDLSLATPFPSTNLVSGMSGTASRAIATINGFSHTFPSDVTMVLVNPNRVGLVLLNGTGSSNAVNLNISFDDAAADVVGSGGLFSGVFRPAGGAPFGQFSTNVQALTYVNTLTQLAQGAGNGTWSLYVYDDIGGDAGRINSGWTLRLEQIQDFCNVIISDLVVQKSATPDRVLPNDLVTYSITVSNAGPAIAPGVFLTENLSSALTLVKVAQGQGTSTVNNNTIQFNLGTMAIGQSVSLSVVGRATLPLDISSTSSASSTNLDPSPADNFATVTTSRGKFLANTNQIVIPDSGPASLYPSTITVSGVTGIVKQVRVNISGLGHSYARDIDMLLVSPSGQKIMLLSDGGPGSGLAGLNLVFSDDAPSSIPLNGFLSGVYKPTDYDQATDTMPAPAPAGPYTNSLGSLSGLDPNGVWSLYVADDTRQESGTISNGWSLDLFLGNNFTNDLSVTQTFPTNLFRGVSTQFMLAVTNQGPTNATSVYVTNVIPANVGLVSVTPSQGSHTIVGNTVIVSLGSLARNASASVQMVVVPTLLGSVTNLALVQTDDNDPNAANNASLAVASVVLAPGVTENPVSLDIPSIGTASAYPSTVTVSGLTGRIGKITVTLNRLSHTFPSDLDVLLVGPFGQKAILMSRVGAGNPINNATFTFDDSATDFISQSFLQSGTYKPRNLSGPGENLPTPAPVGPYADTLATFVGTNPNGIWSLYIADHGEGDAGALAAGWSMVIELAPTLKIRRSGSDVLLSWPSSASNFVLQGVSEFSTNYSWTNLSLTPVVIGNENVVTNQTTNSTQFFRLSR